MTQVKPDADLFTPIKDDGSRPVEYLRDADEAFDAISVVVLNAEIARIGKKMHMDILAPGIRHPEKIIEMAEYLARQKLRIPIDDRHQSFVGNGPISEALVNELLETWNFHPEHIRVNIKKRNKRFGYGCYVEVTFEKR